MAALAGCCMLNLCECAACMACSCLCGIVKASLSQAARFGHLLIVVVTFTLAIILGTSYPNKINDYNEYSKIDLTAGCHDGDKETCIYRQLIYRASFALMLLFTLLAIGSSFSNTVNKSLWVLKFGAAIGGFVGFWWGDNSFFSGFAEFARILSFIWLLVQGLLFLDLNLDLHDIVMDKEDNKPVYLGLSAGALGCVITGFVFIFKDYAGCNLGMLFAVITLLFGVVTTIVSLLDVVNRGLLTPCLMFAYSVFMCWYALMSSPQEACNPTADKNTGAGDAAIITVSIISLTILMYCIVNGTKILNIFNPEGQGVMASNYSPTTSEQLEAALTSDAGTTTTTQPSSSSGGGALNTTKANSVSGAEGDAGDMAGDDENSSGTPQERVFFHVLMVLVSCYGAMILTNWGKTSGAKLAEGSDVVGNESMWLKIISQWIFIATYCRALHVFYNNNSA